MKLAYILAGCSMIAPLFTGARADDRRPLDCDSAARKLILRAAQEEGIGSVAFEKAHCPSPLSEETKLRIERSRWDPVFATLEFRLRCQPATACLPFLVRVRPEDPVRAAHWRTGLSKTDVESMPASSGGPASVLVRPGQTVMLVWNVGSLRITRPMVCLDPGRAGQQVRTRSRAGGRMVRARVLSAEVVEAIL